MHKYTIPWSPPTPPAYRSPSLSDTGPQGPRSVELSRQVHQNTQNFMVAETPRLQDTHLPRGPPFRSAGGRKWAGQDSALTLSGPADGESNHLPLDRAPGTPPSTPDPCLGLSGDALCQSLSVGHVQESPPFSHLAVPELCCGHWPVLGLPCLHPRPRLGEEWGSGLAGHCCRPWLLPGGLRSIPQATPCPKLWGQK